jgi:PilZ domain.
MRPVLKVDARKVPRSRCRIDSKVRHLNQQVDARVVNVSRAGVALELFGKLHAASGSTVQIENPSLGLLEGTVRWCRNGRLGVHLRQSSKTLAQMSAYFRNFHRDSRPVLTR